MLWCKMAYNDYAIRYAHLLRGDYMNGSQGEATKKSAFGRRIDAFKVRHEALWQFIMFNLLSLCATVTDLGVYTLLNSRLLVGLKDISVTWWLLDYSSEAGGLAALISTAAAYVLAQAVNFFVQRKGTFNADNNVAASGVMYIVMIVGIWFFQIWFSAILLGWLLPVLGEFWGGLAMRAINGMVALLIQFPLNKFVIMRKSR